MSVAQPKCFSDRSTWKETDKYVFISYAHKDSDEVYRTLNLLYDGCLNFWYDKKLQPGDEWDDVVEAQIRNPNCVGILLFLSPNAVKSAAIEQEISIYKSIRESGRYDFKLVPISIQGKSVNATVRDTYLSLANVGDSELQSILPQERVAKFLSEISDKSIYVTYSPGGEHALTLIENFKGSNPEIFCSDDAILSRLVEYGFLEKNDEKYVFSLGQYPQHQAVLTGMLDKEGVIQNGEDVFTLKDYKPYLHESINWIIINSDAEKLVAVSQLALDCMNTADTNTFIQNIFPARAFNNEEKSFITSVKLCNIEDLKEFYDYIGITGETDYCKSYPFSVRGMIPLYWCRAEGKQAAYVQLSATENGLQMWNGAANFCAVRLCIELSVPELIQKIQTNIN